MSKLFYDENKGGEQIVIAENLPGQPGTASFYAHLGCLKPGWTAITDDWKPWGKYRCPNRTHACEFCRKLFNPTDSQALTFTPF